LAGFQVTLIGRFWVTAEVTGQREDRAEDKVSLTNGKIDYYDRKQQKLIHKKHILIWTDLS
jgi:hypothetical protein